MIIHDLVESLVQSERLKALSRVMSAGEPYQQQVAIGHAMGAFTQVPDFSCSSMPDDRRFANRSAGSLIHRERAHCNGIAVHPARTA